MGGRSGICPCCDRASTQLERHHDHGPKPGRFAPTLICGECNRLEGQVRVLWGIHGAPSFSLAPSEIRCVIRPSGREGRFEIDQDAVVALMTILAELGPFDVVLDPASMRFCAPIALRAALKIQMRIAAEQYAAARDALGDHGKLCASVWSVGLYVTDWRRILRGELAPHA